MEVKILFERLKRTLIYDCPWITLFVDKVKINDTIFPKYHMIHFKSKSVVVLVKKDEEILFVKSFRHTLEEIQLELPAGFIDKGESPIETAKREVLEETAITVKNLKKIYEYYPSNGISDQLIYIFTADYESGIAKGQDSENDGALWIPKEKVDMMLDNGELTDGLTLSALLLAQRNNR